MLPSLCPQVFRRNDNLCQSVNYPDVASRSKNEWIPRIESYPANKEQASSVIDRES